ncbi:MAG: hypothetical protein ACI8VJ_000044 [Polaribacter sp.]|jgi:hypothetical protein
MSNNSISHNESRWSRPESLETQRQWNRLNQGLVSLQPTKDKHTVNFIENKQEKQISS